MLRVLIVVFSYPGCCITWLKKIGSNLAKWSLIDHQQTLLCCLHQESLGPIWPLSSWTPNCSTFPRFDDCSNLYIRLSVNLIKVSWRWFTWLVTRKTSSCLITTSTSWWKHNLSLGPLSSLSNISWTVKVRVDTGWRNNEVDSFMITSLQFWLLLTFITF